MRDNLVKIMLFMLQADLVREDPQAQLVTPARTALPSLAKVGKVDVPYVPSPENVVAEMLRIAEIGGEDRVCDLGCGDGRIVIAAARKTAARSCVGIDIDPQRLLDCRRNARKAGVGSRAEFREDDFFTADISFATVVTLYLLPSLNLRLRSRLLAQLRPGARIVSHDFDMGEWKPERLSRVAGSLHKVFCWVVPANITGNWKCRVEREGIDGDLHLRLRQKYQHARGTCITARHVMPLNDIRVSGDHVRFTMQLEVRGTLVPVKVRAIADGNVMEGIVKWEEGGREIRVPWQAERDPGGVQTIDTPVPTLPFGWIH